MPENIDWLAVVGDAVWILVLSAIAGSTRAAWQNIKPGALIPMRFSPKGPIAWRWAKPAALLFTPILATLVGLSLGWAARADTQVVGLPLIAFGLRMLLAPPFLMLHHLYLSLALEALAEEGALRS